jgi:hypothetical protein
VIRSLDPRANSLCHNEQDSWTELDLVKKELASSAYCGKNVDSFIIKNLDIGRRRMTLATNLYIISMPYIRRISDKFKRMNVRFNIRNFLKLNILERIF